MARARGKDSLKPAKKGGRRRRVVYVFTEGKVTEPEYIKIIRDRAGTTDVDVHIANASAPGSQRKPLALVTAAVQLMRDELRVAKRNGLDRKYWPAVWCLFDRDDHDSVDAALKQAEEGGVGVAFSHPCFEVWRLLHFKPVTGSFSGVCDVVAQRLPFARTTENIKTVLPEQIPVGSFVEAKKRALKMNAEHDDHVLKAQRDPYTDVYEFVEKGLGVSSY